MQVWPLDSKKILNNNFGQQPTGGVQITHKNFPVPGAWTIIPILRPLIIIKYKDSDVRWILFVEPHTPVRCGNLVKALPTANRQKACPVLSCYHGGDDDTIVGERYSYGYGKKFNPGKGCCQTRGRLASILHRFPHARPQDYPLQVLARDHPASFHRLSSSSSRIYGTWFQHQDSALSQDCSDELYGGPTGKLRVGGSGPSPPDEKPLRRIVKKGCQFEPVIPVTFNL